VNKGEPNLPDSSFGHLSFNELESLAGSGEVDTVIVAFPDHLGQLMGKRLTAQHFLRNRLEHECCDYLLTVDIDMNPLPGFPSAGWDKGFGNYQLKIDTGTLRRIDWPSSAVLVFADLQSPGGEELSHNPRTMLKKQIRQAELKGFRPMAASELEFYLFRNGSESLEPSTDLPLDYHIGLTQKDEPLLRELRNRLDRSGITVESSKGETGKGQYEIALAYQDALEMADRHILFKHGVKAITGEMDYSVTFMAKHSHRDSGSSGHIHMSLVSTGDEHNVFRREPEGLLSSSFAHFLGGIISKTPELFLLFAPTVNSYKRFTADSFAPTSVSWGYDNRTAAFRVVGSGESLRLENRLPGADMNPYTAFAAMIAAGLYGMEHRIEPPAASRGNAYQETGSSRVPSSLEAAADLLEHSEFAREVFGDQAVEFYVRHARLESDAFASVVTDWEKQRYFTRI